MRLFLVIFILFSHSAFAESYTQACFTTEDDTLQFILTSSFTSGSDLSWVAVAFEDEQCRKPYLKFSRYFKITRVQNGEIDLKSTKSTYTILTDEVARALNLIGYCDLHNWQTGVETDVSGRKCEDYQQLQIDQRFLQIFQLTDSGLYWGRLDRLHDGLSPKNRPDQLETIPYLKR